MKLLLQDCIYLSLQDCSTMSQFFFILSFSYGYSITKKTHSQNIFKRELLTAKNEPPTFKHWENIIAVARLPVIAPEVTTYCQILVFETGSVRFLQKILGLVSYI